MTADEIKAWAPIIQSGIVGLASVLSGVVVAVAGHFFSTRREAKAREHEIERANRTTERRLLEEVQSACIEFQKNCIDKASTNNPNSLNDIQEAILHSDKVVINRNKFLILLERVQDPEIRSLGIQQINGCTGISIVKTKEDFDFWIIELLNSFESFNKRIGCGYRYNESS